MGRIRTLLGLAVLATLVVAASVAVTGASAANSPTFRDCSFTAGLDPDFVQLSGATAGPQGHLTAKSQQKVKLEASESSDPGDSSGHVTLTAKVTAPGVAARTVSGHATGKVFLKLPLVGSPTGRTNTISWSATFDNGNHHCPSSQTPQNASPRPFVVKVTGPACVVPKLKGKTLSAAKTALKAAHCALGKVTPKGQTMGTVKKQSPKAGKVLPAGSKVNVTLG
jgi:PASTA domain